MCGCLLPAPQTEIQALAARACEQSLADRLAEGNGGETKLTLSWGQCAGAPAHRPSLNSNILKNVPFPRVGPNAHAQPRADGALFLLCACATVIPHSRPPTPPFRPGREGRELRKGGKGGWRGRGERLLTPWLRNGEAAAASAEERRR